MGKPATCAGCGARIGTRRVSEEFMDVCPVCLARFVRPLVRKAGALDRRERKSRRSGKEA